MNKTTKRPNSFPAVVIAGCALCLAAPLQAQTAITDWTVFDTTNTSGLNTDSPVIGDGITPGDGVSVFVGLFDQTVSLPVGYTLEVSYDVSFTTTATNSNQRNIRTAFANFTTNPPTGTDYDYSFRSDGKGEIFETDLGAGANVISDATGNPTQIRGPVTADPTNIDPRFQTFTYTYSITREASDKAGFDLSFVGGAGDPTNVTSASVTGYTTTSFDFNGIGMLSSVVDATRSSYSNVQYTVVPELGNFALIGGVLALGSIMLRRRRS